MKSWLDTLERLGNKLPHPALIFVCLCVFVMLMSAAGAALQWQTTLPTTGEHVVVQSLFTQAGFAFVLGSAIENFVQFAPVGSALVAMLGIGIAEQSGLLGCLLRAVVISAPSQLLGFFVVLAGVLSSVAADAGYVVLIPLAALLFKAAGRNPLIGLAAAFAGVSGGYGANLLITPNDAILAGITTEAMRIVKPDASITVTANHFFKMASGVAIAITGALITAMLERHYPKPQATEAIHLHAHEKRALRLVGVVALVLTALFVWLCAADTSPLQTAGKTLTQSPTFGRSIVVLITLATALCGIVYGFASAQFRTHHDVVSAAESAIASMAGYIVLMFFAAQFISYFNWSKLGVLLSMNGAQWLQTLSLPAIPMMFVFVVIVALINLMIGSSSAAWALLAPVFVPMFMLVGISPELTQAAYRIGDSSTNIITPLMPYFGIVVAFAQRHNAQAGMGTLMALMLPYAIGFFVCWTAILFLWIGLNLPLGF